MEAPLLNTFALYVNGRRKPVIGMLPCDSEDATDPYISYGTPPAPDGSTRPDSIRKTSIVEDGKIKPAPAATKTRIRCRVSGESCPVDACAKHQFRRCPNRFQLLAPTIPHFRLALQTSLAHLLANQIQGSYRDIIDSSGR